MNRWNNPLLAVTLVVLTAACYLPALSGEFVFDDSALVRDNPLVRDADGLVRIWCSSEPIDYWPLSYTSFWLQFRLFGEQSTGYHIVNLGLHCLVSLLMWRVLARLGIGGAWLAALLFAIHPVNVETGAWVFQQKSTLAAVLYFASILVFLRHEEMRGWRTLAGSLLLFVLAMLAKTSVVMLPLVLLGAVWWRQGRVARGDLFRAAPFFIVALALGALATLFQFERAIGDEVVRDDGFLARLAGAGWAVWFYLGKALCPLDLCFVYPRWQVDPAAWTSYLPGVALLGVLLIAWRFRETSWGRPLLASACYFILALGPVLGFVDISYMRFSLVADHWQYLALVAPVALMAGTWHALWKRLIGIATSDWRTSRRKPDVAAEKHVELTLRRSPRTTDVALRASAIAVVAAFAVLTWRQCHIYVNEEALFSATLRSNPDAWLAHNNLGRILTERGEVERGEQCFREALRGAPGNGLIIANLAQTLLPQNRLQECLALLEPALQAQPASAELNFAMGLAHGAAKRERLACNCYRTALRLSPNHVGAHEGLATALLRQGDLATARRHFDWLLARRPNSTAALIGLGKIAKVERDPQRALRSFQQAAAVDSNCVEAHLNLVIVLDEQQRQAESIAYLQQVVSVQPRSAPLHAALGERLATQRQVAQAMAHLTSSLELDPLLPEAHAAMADLMAQARDLPAATRHFREALRLKPELHAARTSLANLLASQDQTEAAIVEYRAVLAAQPESPGVCTNLAWLLAIRPTATPADRAEAIQLAEEACRQTSYRHPVSLDTLATAYASAGDFDRAIALARQAQQQATAIGQNGFARDVEQRLHEYERLASRPGEVAR